MIDFKIVDPVSFATRFSGVSERIYRKAFSHSANAAILTTRTFIIRALMDSEGLKRKDIAPKLDTIKSTVNTLNAKLVDGGKALPLSAFSARSKIVKSARGKRTGVTVVIDGVRQLIPEAFLITFANGHRGIYRRKSYERFPIEEVKASKVSQMFNAVTGLRSRANQQALSSFRENFKRDFEYYKAKEKGTG